MVCQTVVRAGADKFCMPADVPDYLFRCSYCIKLIAEDSPVYMRHDHCYCSAPCRDKGLSKLYKNLKESQLQEVSSKLSSDSHLDRVKDDSSSTSQSTYRTRTDTDGGGDAGRLGPFARLGKAMLDAMLHRVASRAWGVQILRTCSASLLWGQELNNSSSAGRMLDYFPEADGHVRAWPYDRCLMSCDRFDVVSS